MVHYVGWYSVSGYEIYTAKHVRLEGSKDTETANRALAPEHRALGLDEQQDVVAHLSKDIRA